MRWFHSMRSAFAMYSRIPTGKIEWVEENRRYALCFFPLIGLVIGGSLMVWQWLAGRLHIGSSLFAAVALLIPIVITGGIHMDGFYDVIDAQSSCQSKEKKLAIMSDPHIGAFSGMKGSLYFLMMFALFTEIQSTAAACLVALGYVLSRILSGLAAVTFQAAKKEGALADFVRPADRQVTLGVLIISWAVIALLMLYTHRWGGSCVLLTSGLLWVGYRRFAYRSFGGITGDLAGYFLQVCEMGVLTSVVIIFKLLEVVEGCI